MRWQTFSLLLVIACLGCKGSDQQRARDAGGANEGSPADAREADTGESDAGVYPDQVFTGPPLLSESGLYADISARTLADGVMPYSVRFELWADGAEKQRWLYLPPGTQIDTHDPDAWRFPIGTKAWKEFRVNGVLVETRMLHKIEANRWDRVAYVWRADGSDADARPDGVPNALGTTHDVPNLTGCFDCHRGGVDNLLGVGAIQLATGATDEPLTRFEAAGLLSIPLPERPSVPGNDVEVAALGYLHANCGHCHSDVHPLATLRTIRMHLPYGLHDASQAPAVLTIVGAAMHHTILGTSIGIVPGHPEVSQLWIRMQHRSDGFEMPPRGTKVIDDTAVAAVRAWIAALPP